MSFVGLIESSLHLMSRITGSDLYAFKLVFVPNRPTVQGTSKEGAEPWSTKLKERTTSLHIFSEIFLVNLTLSHFQNFKSLFLFVFRFSTGCLHVSV